MYSAITAACDNLGSMPNQKGVTNGANTTPFGAVVELRCVALQRRQTRPKRINIDPVREPNLSHAAGIALYIAQLTRSCAQLPVEGIM